MADIFVSYARVDKTRVAPLITALEAQGWSVWWDPEIMPGQEFDALISKELKHTGAVIVVWTPASVQSRWVRGEARIGADAGILVPVRFDAAELPIDARAVHTTDLDGWHEETQSRPFKDLVRAIKPLVDRHRAVNRSEPDAPFLMPARGVSVCVLPFANMSGDAEQEYFSDGISEDIITDLSKVTALLVIARSTAFTFKGRHVDVPQVARQLKISHILEGSVRKSGNRVRITAQLIDGATGGHVWAERYDRDLADIFALQDEISQAIVAALKLKLFPEEKQAIEQRGTAHVEAYDKYLRARGLHNQQGPAELRRAIQIYREALGLDPGFIAAWCGLYDAHRDAAVYAAESTEDASKGMAEAAARILALAPDAWRSHALRARQFIVQRRFLEAEGAAAAALVAAPASEVEAIWTYANFLFYVGRVQESIEPYRRVLQADLLSLLSSMVAQAALTVTGRLTEADAEYERSKDLSGDRDAVENLAVFRALARGDAAAAKALLRRYMDCDTVPVVGLEDLVEIFDRPETMLVRLRQGQAAPANQDATRQLKIAVWAGWHGDTALAAAVLRRYVIDLHAPRLGGIWIPPLSAARRTPAFKEMVREIGLADYWRQSGHWGDFARPLGNDDFEVFR